MEIVQVVAVERIFTFQNKFVGPKVSLGRVTGGRWIVLDIFEGQWEVSGRASCLHQNMFLSKKKKVQG